MYCRIYFLGGVLCYILDENFIKNDDGTWRLVNENDDIDKEKQRTKSLLKEFKIYVETAKKPRGKLPKVRLEAVRAGFKQCYSDKNFADIIQLSCIRMYA